MRKKVHVVLLIVAAAAGACRENTANAREMAKSDSSAAMRDNSGYAATEGALSKNAVTLRENMRKLWSDHVVWTREYIVAAVGGNAGAPVVLKRLMKNQEEIGSAVGTYYGNVAGDSLTKLLKDHIAIAGELVGAAVADNSAKMSAADKKWHDNATNIAAYLAAANPNWSKDDLEHMLKEHLSLTTQEAKDRIGKKWDDDVSNFDKIHEQAMHMADALTDGIMKQFPNKVM